MKSAEEAPSRIEPCLLEDTPPAILDLATALAAATASLGNRLHPASAAALADTVQVMNCYYSNLIEGHNTTPREIESALAGTLTTETDRRDLQVEARAHIRVQRAIDRMYEAGELPEPASASFIEFLHRAFYEGASDRMLLIGPAGHQVRMTPGTLRAGHDPDITVGRHHPPSGDRVPDFMAYFERRYRFAQLGKGQRLTAMAAAHHRLNYIHPFLDGNGRVSRLMSHAMALQAGIGAHGLWSVSRGLARGLESRGDYKRMMDHADMPRQGDLDGRGNLSRRALIEFTAWFLDVCLDQVTFMAGLFQLDTLRGRFDRYVHGRQLRPESIPLLHHVLIRGELPRGEAGAITGLKERSARDLLAALLAQGILGSDTPKGPVSLRFPLHAVERLFPSLFPES